MTVRLVIRWKTDPPAAPPVVQTAPAEQRIHQRLPVNYRFSVYSDASQAGQRSMIARGINMSKSGVLIETSEPIPVGTVVYIRTSELGLMGAATVRHCTPKGSKFRLGLHFPTPLMRCM
ncbi:MAG TPA: PilZ domain-containing protein [Bryobacteraceae bacterium]|nr:PilZ domain-containing protein [Bryobacteraceae bacterium]